MRNTRIFGLIVVAALVLVPSFAFADTTDAVVNEDVIQATPSKVCHPKKPITCRASDLQIDMATLLTPSNEPAQSALICHGPRWLCAQETIGSEETLRELTQPARESEQALICHGPRWLCAVNILY